MVSAFPGFCITIRHYHLGGDVWRVGGGAEYGNKYERLTFRAVF